MARAKTWSDVKLQYCWAPNGGDNHKAGNMACQQICRRKSDPRWDPYRSDCSGLVSWAWGLPAPGRTTSGFYPFQNDLTQGIQASDLRPGDAVNNNHHIMLFKEWVTPGRKATFIEEPGCSSATPYARETTSDVTISGMTITPAGRGAFTAIRNPKLQVGAAEPPKPPPTPTTTPTTTPTPTTPPKTPLAGGSLDEVTCEGVRGWAMGSSHTAVDVELTFFDARGKDGAETARTAANTHRADLPAANADVGFVLRMPLGARDGKAHPVFAYAMDTKTKAAVLLQNAPKTFTCTPPSFPLSADLGARRLLAAATVAAWKLTPFQDVAKEPETTTVAFAKGPDFPAEPLAIQSDDGSKEVFVVDGGLRRVVDAAGIRSWKLVPSKRPAADVAKLTQGPAWPSTPFIFKGDGPEIYALDSKLLPPAAANPPPAAVAPTHDDNAPKPGEDGQPQASQTPGGDNEKAKEDATAPTASEGCSQNGASSGSNGIGALLAVGLGCAAAARRRRRGSNR